MTDINVVNLDTSTKEAQDRYALKFDPEKHQYSVGNTIFPSITQILKAEGFIDSSWHNDYAMNKGTIVHLIIHQFDSGILFEDEVDKQYLPYLDAYKAFLDETGSTVISSEQPLCNQSVGYAGTPDKVIRTSEDIKRVDIVEIKTGQPASWHQLQTAAQEALVMSSYEDVTICKRYCLYIKRNGKYRLVLHNDRSDNMIWKSALAIHNWKRNNQGGK